MADKINDGGPAFPRPVSELRIAGDESRQAEQWDGQDGMTLRDYFAAKALAGQLASDAHPDVVLERLMDSPAKIADRAKFAYQLADAMLAEREKVR